MVVAIVDQPRPPTIYRGLCLEIRKERGEIHTTEVKSCSLIRTHLKVIPTN